MNYRERMKEYLKEPDEHSSQYGKWAILNREQRDLIKRLLREMDSADEVIKHQYFEIERLNNIMTELETELYAKYHEHKDSECEELYAKAQEDKEILDYIKELKESKK